MSKLLGKEREMHKNLENHKKSPTINKYSEIDTEEQPVFSQN